MGEYGVKYFTLLFSLLSFYTPYSYEREREREREKVAKL